MRRSDPRFLDLLRPRGRQATRRALLVGGGFLAASVVWIVGTDLIVARLALAPGAAATVGIIKDVAFILGVLVLIGALCRAWMNRQVLFEQAIEQAGEAVLITDAAARIIYVNRAFESITGYTRDEIRGENPRILQSGEHDDAFYERMWAALGSGRAWRSRFVNRRKDGERYHQDSVVAPVHGPDGRITNYVAVARDMSREIVLEQQLRQAQKIEAVGQLTSGIAHDFNNLLSVIMANASLLEAELPPDAGADSLTDIQKAAAHGGEMVRQLLGFSRQADVTFQPLSLGQVVSDAAAILRRTIPERIRIHVALDPAADRVHGDAGVLQQILINLANNARDAMPDGGDLTFTLGRAVMDDAFIEREGFGEHGDYACLQVTDTGCGMDEATRQRVFEPFFTTKAPGLGTGLGLAMAYGLVKQMHGFISVESTPGEGTVFAMYFPLSDDAAPVAPAKAGGDEALTGGSERILLVEDEEAVRRAAERTLQRLGYEVVTAADGTQGLARLADDRAGFALILSDAVMPEMGGIEFLERLRQQGNTTPFILMTGYSRQDLNEGPGGRILHVLPKPWTLEELARAVRRALDD